MDAARKIVQIDEVRPNRSKKSRRGTLFGAITAVALLAAAGGAFFLLGSPNRTTVQGFDLSEVRTGDLTVTSSASGTVVLPQTVSVTAPQTGYADQVFVKEGDIVKEGTLLALLTVPDLQDNKQDLLAQLTVATISYEDLANDWDFTLQTAKTSLTRLDASIAEAQKDVDAKKELATLKSSRQSEYDTALVTLQSYQEKREDAAAQLANNLKKRELSLTKQKATIDQLQTSLNRTLANIEESRIKSPLAGEVLSIASSLSVPKSLISQHDILIKVADRASTFIDLEVNESDAGNLKLGDKLTLTVSTRTLVASITAIGKVASLSSDGLTATVTVRVKPVEAVELTPGASAAATISLGTKKDALTLPRGAFLTTGGQKWVYVVDGDVAKKTAVTFGTLQSNTVEIKSGLKAEDIVITSGYQDFIDQDTIQLKTKQGEAK